MSVECTPVIQSSWPCSVSLYTCASVSRGHIRRRSGVMSKPCAAKRSTACQHIPGASHTPASVACSAPALLCVFLKKEQH